MILSCINIRKVPREMLKTSLGTLRMLMKRKSALIPILKIAETDYLLCWAYCFWTFTAELRGAFGTARPSGLVRLVLHLYWHWKYSNTSYRNEPRHKKTCLCHMRTTKAQISLRNLCCSLSGQYNTSTCYSRNFKTLACRISWASRFES